MKKLTALLLALCLCFASCVMLASCDDDAPEHTHAYKTEWATDATHHWHVCEGEGCTEVADKAEHTWNAGEITTPATHDAQGVKTYTCTACAATKTEAVQGDFTVTAEEWAYAMDYIFHYDNLTFTSIGPVRMSKKNGSLDVNIENYSTVIVRNGSYVSITNSIEGASEISYYVIYQNTAYVEYFEGVEDLLEDLEDVEESPDKVSSDEFDCLCDYEIVELELHKVFKYSNFTYNAETDAYEATGIVFDMTPVVNDHYATFTNCSLRFLDGKLVGVTYTQTSDFVQHVQYVREITITYGTAPVIELPAGQAQ